ncbi:patatin-like phospholipase family protein [Parapedobacter indicus]|uniref:NTE family protein n=1 Tax=Parapedobacter indicus TaxID=1477437 RepID=A0A1I3EUA2_9SPHI|nr:patatin-like phospholipase family protein [Parapedobacter indicus]PPL03411.1 NTE family protein [Parapedobacter indicus]SFI02493.1 NTE family protein [Parapedobacter indicus]
MAFNWIKRWTKPRKVGLALSGGGLRGVGHLGAIKALEEHGFQPAVLSGSSAGAIIGAFYAAGYTVDEMLRIVQENDLFPTTSLRLRTSGFVNTRFLSRLLRTHMPDNTFESLKKPLYVTATNLLSGKTEYFHTGPLDEALLASASVPLLFPAVKHEHAIYYDGGLLDNLPIQPLTDQCNFLIGVHVNAPDNIKSDQLTTVKTLDRVIHLAIGQSVAQNATKCDLFIEPPDMLQFGMFDKKNLMKIYEHVYAHASRQLAKQ